METKKKYITPETVEVKLQVQGAILSGSCQDDDGNNSDYGGD